MDALKAIASELRASFLHRSHEAKQNPHPILLMRSKNIAVTPYMLRKGWQPFLNCLPESRIARKIDLIQCIEFHLAGERLQKTPRAAVAEPINTPVGGSIQRLACAGG